MVTAAINIKHFEEWTKGSGVSEEITRLAIRSTEDDAEIAKATNRSKWKWGQGYLIKGVDPATGQPTDMGLQFKPDTPIDSKTTKKDGTPKLMKYVTAYGVRAAALFLPMPDPEYWQKVKADASIKLWLTEGGKKAGCLLTRGHATASLPGVCNAQKQEELNPEIAQFCQPGRTVVLCFDADSHTNPNVFKALDKTGRLIAAKGAVVQVVEWDMSMGKGIDDYIVNGGSLDNLEVLSYPRWRDKYMPEKDKSKAEIFSKLDEVDPLDHVIHTTFDNHCFTRLFGGEDGDWITIDQAFYKYSDQKGYWRRVDDAAVHKLIIQQSRKAYSLKSGKNRDGESYEFPVYNFAKSGQVKSAFEFCRAALSKTFTGNASTEEETTNKHLRVFRNGTVDLRSGELMPHNREHYLTTAIDSDYVKDAACPEVFRKFIESAYGDDLIEVVRAATAMLLDPSADYHYFIHLIGQSGSGKGTLLRLWQEMNGLDHCTASTSFSELSTPELRHQNLTGKSLFVVSDIGGYVQGLKAFYELVDNGALSGRALFSPNGYTKIWNCRFVVASVEHLKLENSGDGWDRRCIPLPTRPRYAPPDHTLENRLREVKGEIISWALAMPRERREWVIKNLHTFERIEIAKSDASISGDSVRLFVDMCLRPDPSPEAPSLRSQDLHTYYEAFCSAYGYQRMAVTSFAGRLKSTIESHYAPQRRATKVNDPDRPMVPAHWKNIKVLDGCFIDLSQIESSTSFTTFKASSDAVYRCNKSACYEGGLVAFSIYAQRQLKGFDLAEREQQNTSSTYSDVSVSTEKINGIDAGLNAPPQAFNPSQSTATQGFQENGLKGIEGIDTLQPYTKKVEEIGLTDANGGSIDAGHGAASINGVDTLDFENNFESTTPPINSFNSFNSVFPEPLTDAGLTRIKCPSPEHLIQSHSVNPEGINGNIIVRREGGVKADLKQRYEAIKQRAIAAGKWEEVRAACDPDDEYMIGMVEEWIEGGFQYAN